MPKPWGPDYKERRIAAGLTQDEAARLSGVSQQAISRIENQRVQRSWPETKERLEAALEAHIVLTRTADVS